MAGDCAGFYPQEGPSVRIPAEQEQIRTSVYGRDYRNRISYSVGSLEQGRLNPQLGVDAEQRASPLFQMQEQGTDSDQRVLGRATVQW